MFVELVCRSLSAKKLYMHLEVFIAKKKKKEKGQAALKEQLSCIKLRVTGLNARLGVENKKRPESLFILFYIPLKKINSSECLMGKRCISPYLSVVLLSVTRDFFSVVPQLYRPLLFSFIDDEHTHTNGILFVF